MKSFVDVGHLINKNNQTRKNMVKVHEGQKENITNLVKGFSEQGSLIDKIKILAADKQKDLKKLLDHITDMEIQYTNFLEMSEHDHMSMDLEKEVKIEIKKREILLLQNQFMKDQLHKTFLDSEKHSHFINTLIDTFLYSKSIVEQMERSKDVSVGFEASEFHVLQHLHKELKTIKNHHVEVQTVINNILSELNTDIKDVSKELLLTLRQVKGDVEDTIESKISRVVMAEKENMELRKELNELKELSENFLKSMEEQNYKIQCLERDKSNISAKYEELREQASTTITLAEDAQACREELNHVADIIIAASDYAASCHPLHGLPSHYRIAPLPKEGFRNVSNILELALQKYTSHILDLERELKNSKGQLSKKTSEFEDKVKEADSLSSKISDLSRDVESLDEDLKKKLYENSRLQEHLESVKNELFKNQHLNTELGVCIDNAERDKQKLRDILQKMEQEFENIEEEKNKIILQLNNYKIKDESTLAKTMATEEDKIKLKEQVISYQQELQEAIMKIEIQDQQLMQNKSMFKDLQNEMTTLRNTISEKEEKLKVSQGSVGNSSLQIATLEEKIKELQGDRMVLETENGNLHKIKQSLNDDMNILKRELLTAENIKTQQETVCRSLESEIKSLNDEKHKLAGLLSQLQREKGEVCNKLTCISRKKEYLNVELMRLQQRFEQITEVNKKLNGNLEELLKENEEKQRTNDKLEKECSQLTKSLQASKSERQSLELKLLEWSSTLEETTSQKEKLQSEVQCQFLNQSNMRHQITLLKKDLSTSVRSIISLKKLFSKDIMSLENEFLRKVSSIKQLSEENIKKFNAEKAQMQASFEEKLQNALKHLETEKNAHINKLCSELSKLQDHLHEVIQKYESTLRDAENEKQMLLSQIQREKQELEEQCVELKNSLSECQDDFSRSKRESKSTFEENQNSLSALKQELVSLSQRFSSAKDQWEDKRNAYELKLKQLSDEKESTGDQLEEFKTLFHIEQNKSALLKGDLDTTQAKFEEADALITDMKRDLIETRKQLQEAVMEKDKYFDILTDQKESIKQLENQKLRLNGSLDSSYSKIEKLETQVHNIEKENATLQCSLNEASKGSNDLDKAKSQLEIETRRLHCALSDKTATENELRLRLNNEIEEKERMSIQLLNACKKVSELETLNDQIRQELHHAHCHNTQEKHKWHDYEMSFQKQFEEQRTKEQRLQDKNHNLEICLSDASQQIQELSMTLGTFEDKIRFLDEKCCSTEKERLVLLDKYVKVSSTLRNIAGVQLDGSINLLRVLKGTGFSCAVPEGSNEILEPDQVSTGIKALVSYTMQTQQEKESLEEKISNMEKESLCMIEKQKSIEQKMNKLHHALRACQHDKTCIETKLAQKIVSLRALEGALKSKSEELRAALQKLTSTETYLKNIINEKEHIEDHLNQLRDKLASLEIMNGSLQDSIKSVESKCAKLEIERVALEGDLHRAETVLREKEMHLASLSERSEKQARHISCLEERCEELQSSVKRLQTHIEQQNSNENVLKSEIKDLMKAKSALEYNLNCCEDKLKTLSKGITSSDNERKVIMDRLESAQHVITDLKRQTVQQKSQIDRFHQKTSDLEMSKSDLEAKLKILKTPLNDKFSNDFNGVDRPFNAGGFQKNQHRSEDISNSLQEESTKRHQLHFTKDQTATDNKYNPATNSSQKLSSIRQALSNSLRNVAGDPDAMRNERKRLDYFKKDCF